ncbi:MAG TPA: FliH/SctL family protein [Sphingomonas sp.]|jgi:flagellar biosynthesis/type III secretory pathway protein FliH|nr:FliH/SctL family protein [Sphingomonas sp.]
MTAVIKDHAGVRRFAAGHVPAPAVDPATEHARLTEALAQAQADTKAAADVAHAAGRAEGHRAGLAAAVRQDAARRDALDAGIARALAQFDEALTACERLAAALARAALAKAFAPSDTIAEPVLATIARNAALFRDAGAVAIRVSAADFADAGAAQDVAERGTGAPIVVTIDPALPAGACRVTARLGTIDLGLDTQWSALAALLDDLARA